MDGDMLSLKSKNGLSHSSWLSQSLSFSTDLLRRRVVEREEP
jgi:hypothetical protein